MGVGKVAQQLRALTALPEDSGSIPEPTWQLTTVQEDLIPSSGLPGHQAPRWDTDIHASKSPIFISSSSSNNNNNNIVPRAHW